MARRQIYEYPGEILWQSRDLEWYLDNDPEGINKKICHFFVDISDEFKKQSGLDEILNNAYRVAVAIASTKNRDFYPIKKHLFDCYGKTRNGKYAMVLGCMILLCQTNSGDYHKVTDDIINYIRGYYFDGVLNKLLTFDQSLGYKVKTDLSPSMGSLSRESKYWLLDNIKSTEELETVISFIREKKMQMEFVETVVDKLFTYHPFPSLFMILYDLHSNNDRVFTLSPSQYQTLKDNVGKGMYLRKTGNEKQEERVKRTDIEANDKEIAYWQEIANKYEMEANNCKETIKRLEEKISLLKQKNDAKEVNSGDELKNDEYKKEIEEKSKQIDDLMGRLTNEMISMSDIVGGFKRMSGMENRDELVRTYKSLNTMLKKNRVWLKYTDEIERIFIEEKKKGIIPTNVGNYYAEGATHNDSHKEIHLNTEDKKLLE